MQRIVKISLIFVLILAFVGSALSGTSVEAQNQELCYAVADGDENSQTMDQLVSLDKLTGTTTDIGPTGTYGVEAIGFDTDGVTLYAADEDQLGTLDLTTGAFTALPNTFGSGEGADGSLTFDDVDGLSIDPATGNLYGTERRGSNDVLIKIDKSTGAHISDAFGAGVDYVVISGTGVMQDIDDIAIDPVTGVMYAASNSGGTGGVLVTVDMSTGAATVIGEFGVDDIEGLAFFTDGQLYGSTGKYYSDEPGTEDRLYTIDEISGAATNPLPFSEHTDYEALGCLTEPTSVGLASIHASGSNGIASRLGLLLGLTALVGFTSVVVWRRVALLDSK